MILLGIWLATSLLLGAGWALAGLLLCAEAESPSRVMLEAESGGEAA